MFVNEVSVQVGLWQALVGNPQDGALFVLIGQEQRLHMGALAGGGTEGGQPTIRPGILDNADGIDGGVLIFEIVGQAGGIKEIGEGPILGRAVSHQPAVAQENVLATNRQGGGQVQRSLPLHVEVVENPVAPLHARVSRRIVSDSRGFHEIPAVRRPDGRSNSGRLSARSWPKSGRGSGNTPVRAREQTAGSTADPWSGSAHC